MDQNNSGKKLIIIVLIVILVAIVLAIWFSLRGQPVSLNGVQPEDLSFRQAQDLNREASLDVPDQFPGAIVYVSRVDLPAGGFVVVRKNVDGQPGDVMGATFFDKDTRIGNVDLNEATADGESYFAQGWTDDGDAKFSATADKIITKTDDAVLQVPFKATKNLPEKKD